MRIDGFRLSSTVRIFAALRNEPRRCVLHVLLTCMRGRNPGCTAQCRRWGACFSAAVLLAVSVSSSAQAQAISPLTPPASPPWNAERIFEPVPYAQLWSHYPGEKIDPEDTPVSTRQWPGYEPKGVRDHDWIFYPSVSAGGLYDSNVFASNGGGKSYIAGVLNPSLRVERLSDGNPLTFDTYVKSTRYSHYSSLDQTDARARLRGRIDLRDSDALLYNFQAAYLHEAVGSLSSPLGAVSPTPYGYTHEDLTYWHHHGRLSFSLGASNENYDFGSAQAQNGSTISEDSRDGSVNKLHSRFDYAFGANFGVFTAIEGNVRDLRGSSSGSLSSQGLRSLTGVNFNLTHLISGEIGVGYTSQHFEDPTIGTVSAPAYRALLRWSPTRALDFTLKGEEITTEAVDTVTSAVRAQAVMLRADYSLRRNVVLSALGSYENDKFVGQDRQDNVYSTVLSVQYLLNRFSSIGLDYKYVNRKSNLTTATYDKHEVGLNVTAHF